jgi:hypothetical protein
VLAVEEKEELEPLYRLATRRYPDGSIDFPGRDWQQLSPPYVMARAEPRPTTIVSEWMSWGEQRTPYIARHNYGLGSVTWVAQDLGDPTLTRYAVSNWPYVWDRVFDWRNDTIIVGPDTAALNITELGAELGLSPDDLLESYLDEAGIRPAQALEFSSMEAIRRCVEEGLGVALIPEVWLIDSFRTGALAPLDWFAPAFEVTTQLVWHPSRWQGPALTALIEASETCIGDPFTVIEEHGSRSCC